MKKNFKTTTLHPRFAFTVTHNDFNSKIKTNEGGGTINTHEQYLLNKLGVKIKVYFNYNEIIDFKLFTERIVRSIKPNKNYMLLAKVRYKHYEYLTFDAQ